MPTYAMIRLYGQGPRAQHLTLQQKPRANAPSFSAAQPERQVRRVRRGPGMLVGGRTAREISADLSDGLSR